MEAMKEGRVEKAKIVVEELALNGHLWEHAINEHTLPAVLKKRDALIDSASACGVSWKTK